MMEISIDGAGLSKIYAADQSVTLTRAVGQSVVTNAAARGAGTTVAWQAFAPLQTNTVSWTDEYYCYATTTPLAIGAVIAMNSQCSAPVHTGPVYEFTRGQFIQQPATGSSYVVANAATSGSFAFGLAQNATINNLQVLSPVCADPVLYNEAIYLTPTDLIAIFLSSAGKGGTVIPRPVNAFSIKISSASLAVTIGFNDQTNTFYQIA
jgi:hypothetical protein